MSEFRQRHLCLGDEPIACYPKKPEAWRISTGGEVLGKDFTIEYA
jgi:hypothetical protein